MAKKENAEFTGLSDIKKACNWSEGISKKDLSHRTWKELWKLEKN